MKKKLILISILSILSILSVGAQGKRCNFGIKTGINYSISSISKVGPAKFDNKVGIDIGFFINYSVSKKFMLSTELLYSSRNIGYEVNKLISIDNFGNESYKGTNKDRYIDVVFLAKYYLTDKLGIEAGPQIGFMTNNDKRVIINDRYLRKSGPKDKFNFSGNIGFKYDIGNRFDLGIRYNFALLETNGFQNSIIQLSIGYKLN